jgi:hypothetical protein
MGLYSWQHSDQDMGRMVLELVALVHVLIDDVEKLVLAR